MKTRQSVLDEFKGQFDVGDFLRDVLGIWEFEENGDELIMRCPLPFDGHLHGDEKPSAALNRDSLLFNCFTEALGGDLLWLVQQVKGITFQEAAEEIAQFCQGREFNSSSFSEKLYSIFAPYELSTIEPVQYDERILNPWIQHSFYLEERGITSAIQQEMKTGAVTREEVGHQVIRCVVPHFFKGSLLGWTMRFVSTYPDTPQLQVPKYIHSVNFPKKNTLFNYDKIDPNKPVLVVESPLSVLYLMSNGERNCVATFGAAVTDGQISLLREFPEILVFPDGDKAGYGSTFSLLDRLKDFSHTQVVLPLLGKDPADIADVSNYIRYNIRDGTSLSLSRIFSGN